MITARSSTAYLGVEQRCKQPRGQPLAKRHQAVPRPRCQVLSQHAEVVCHEPVVSVSH